MAMFYAAVLSACGLIQDRSSDYVKADPGKEITLPSHFKGAGLSARYPIPEVENQRSIPAVFVLPEPPDATAALKVAPYLIENIDGEVWLHLFSAPNNVWPLIDLFWTQYDLAIVNENPRRGILTTQQLDSDLGSQSLMNALEQKDPEALVIEGMSFQTKAVNGVRRNTSEVQVRALLPTQPPQAATAWLQESVNPRLETTLLQLIGDFVTAEGIDNRHSLLASEIGGDSRVRLLENQWGEGYLELDLSMRRAWNELEQAMLAAGIIIAGQDPENQLFYVSYLSLDDLESWYSTRAMTERRKTERNYSLQLFRQEDGNVIVVVKKLNPKFDDEQKRKILNLVFEYIS